MTRSVTSRPFRRDQRSGPPNNGNGNPFYADHPHNVAAWRTMRGHQREERKRGYNTSALDLAAWFWGKHGQDAIGHCLTPAIVCQIATDVAYGPPGECKPYRRHADYFPPDPPDK